jgi:O-antigen/teichoic acid export membrane protein
MQPPAPAAPLFATRPTNSPRDAGGGPEWWPFSVTGSFFKTVAWKVSATVSGALAGMLMLRLLQAYLLPARYGVVVVALQAMLYLPLLDFGFRTTLNRRLLVESDPARRRRWLHFGQALYLRLGGLVLVAAGAGMVLYAQTATARQAGEPLLFFVTLGAAGAFSVLASAQVNLLVGLGDQRRVFLLNTVGSWANLLGLGVGLRLGWDLWAFPLATAVMALVQLVPAWVWCRLREPDLDWRGRLAAGEFRATFAELKVESLACLRSQFAILFLFTIDVILVGLLTQEAAVAAVYATAARVFGLARGALQAGSEALWPIVARESAGGTHTGNGDWLLRVNAWLYGGAMGAMAVTLTPFIAWFMKPDWAPDPWLVALLAGRFLITGLSSPAAYFLLGLGDFRALARYCERELVAGVLLAVPLGGSFGARGVAGAFLLATVGGTLTPIFWQWARLRGLPAGRLFGSLWARALVAVALSVSLSLAALGFGATGAWTVAVGAAGLVVAAAAGALWAWLRGRKAGLSGRSLADMLRAF